MIRSLQQIIINPVQIVVPLLRHEFETQSKYQGVEESFVVRVQI